jgi:hypothetical protein
MCTAWTSVRPISSSWRLLIDSTGATYNAQSYWLLVDGQLKDFKGYGPCNEAESQGGGSDVWQHFLKSSARSFLQVQSLVVFNC